MFKVLISRKNKGISAFIALAVMTTLLLMVFGLVSIVSPQIKMIGEIGKSVIAFNAADSGIERLTEAIFVGYDYYTYPANGKCIEVEIGEEGEEEMKKVCDYTDCIPSITPNDGENCGLASKCAVNTDCICPKDKCIGYNYYDYPENGLCNATCNGEKCCTACIDPSSDITPNSPDCGYNPEEMESCDDDTDCKCPRSDCMGLEPDARPLVWKTPYSDTLPNGAIYQTYIMDSKSIKSIGIYIDVYKRTVVRAIGVSF